MPGKRCHDFSFVDRITLCADGCITGEYTVPHHVTRFPPSLMAEAVGQLAAWAAMAQLDFSVRPVAGLADDTVYTRAAQPGEILQLEAQLERCDSEAVAYGGRARIGDTVVAELIHCVGPMLPMEEFDAPDAMRADFAMLQGAGAAADRFIGVPEPRVTVTAREFGQRLEAQLDVPSVEEVSYFADHFPRRPVFPGTLLMDALSALSVPLAAEATSARAATLMPTRVGSVKIRAFTAPGTTLMLECAVTARAGTDAHIKVAARNGGRTIATARMVVGPGRRITA
jgi:3-hydroxymyristoyl/3-hydroxydecanoyl-(acyl carrier protein) dehydratase